jgi:hypothetical protein
MLLFLCWEPEYTTQFRFSYTSFTEMNKDMSPWQTSQLNTELQILKSKALIAAMK